ncbi:MAG: D-tyrosyl-tRNA(Tyr) deacylase [Candidatus Hydrogenedentes bacterium]|nr:D-tyrosyl-tRNA(Tyr) deacylase [Candidatus Hydrogenedentota bacterium]
MRAVVQRVREASVSVGGELVSSIGMGLLVLLGVARGDETDDADYLAKKIVALRVFEDNAGKMNLSVNDVGGELLVVSQFTLCADTQKGNRPSFVGAARPERAEPLVERFIESVRAADISCQKGVFGAHMEVALVNDGPVTIVFDTSG